MSEYGIILGIVEVHGMTTRNVGPLDGANKSRLGLLSLLDRLYGQSSMDGYKVITDKTEILVLIDNGQCCCEQWGYLCSEDEPTDYIGAELLKVELTDVALNKEKVEKTAQYGFDGGGIQFVDFVTIKGVFQLAVYNAHNGYYGHGIAVAIGDMVLHEDTL